MHNEEYPDTKEIIYLLGMGAILTATIFMPGLGYTAKMIERAKRNYDWKKSQREWRKFNPYILKRNLKRLREQKVVEIIEKDGEEIIKLTQKGHTKYLKFSLEKLSLNGGKWDGKWRIVVYDIAKFKKKSGQRFQECFEVHKFLSIAKKCLFNAIPM